MSTSLVHRSGYGFWCPDWLLEPFAHSLGSDLLLDPDEAVRSLGLALRAKSTAGLTGCLDMGFDRLTPEQADKLRAHVRHLQERVATDPGMLSSDRLNDIGLGTRFSDGILPDHWSRICAAVVALLGGKWQHTAGVPGAGPGTWLYAEQAR